MPRIKSYGLEVGKLLPLNIAELQISGLATVTAIDECPTISTGVGSVITARFVTRQVDVIVRAEILGADGTVDVIEGSPTHPIWSVDRNDWVPLGELITGEQLSGAGGSAIVLLFWAEQRRVSVYNVEIPANMFIALAFSAFWFTTTAFILELKNGATLQRQLHPQQKEKNQILRSNRPHLQNSYSRMPLET